MHLGFLEGRSRVLFKTLTEPSCIKAFGSSTLQIPDTPVGGSVLSKHAAGIGPMLRTAEQAPTHVIENKSAVLGPFSSGSYRSWAVVGFSLAGSFSTYEIRFGCRGGKVSVGAHLITCPPCPHVLSAVTLERHLHISVIERGTLLFEIGKHTFRISPYPAVPDSAFHLKTFPSMTRVSRDTARRAGR